MAEKKGSADHERREPRYQLLVLLVIRLLSALTTSMEDSKTKEMIWKLRTLLTHLLLPLLLRLLMLDERFHFLLQMLYQV
jgi:hypothetical protein